MNASDLKLLGYELEALEDRLMSQLSDKITELQASTDESIARVQADVSDLQAKIADLQTKVTTDEDIASLEEIRAKLNALDPVSPETLPPTG